MSTEFFIIGQVMWSTMSHFISAPYKQCYHLMSFDQSVIFEKTRPICRHMNIYETKLAPSMANVSANKNNNMKIKTFRLQHTPASVNALTSHLKSSLAYNK